MAPFARLVSPSYSSSFIFRNRDNISPSPIRCNTFSCCLTGNHQTRFSVSKYQRCDERSGLKKHASNRSLDEFQSDEQICCIHCIQDYDKGLQVSKEKLVIAHFSASCNNQTHHNRKAHQFVDVNYRGASSVKFLHVMVDESDKTREICMRENIEKIPCFVFYRNRRKVHEEAGFQPEKLINSIRYHSDDHHSTTRVVRLHAREDFNELIENVDSNKLIVLNVAMRQCMPCVKIYPSVVALANQMVGKAIFARLNADECESCMQMCRDMDVVKVPTFLFFKNGDLCGRYVGSCSSNLIREIEKL